jgi:tetratricopeptide (TPR) repeat protein
VTNRDRLEETVHLTSREQIQRRWGGVQTWLLLGVALVLGCAAAPAAELKEAEDLYLSGDYSACTETASQMVHHRPASEDWQILLSQALLASGKYPEAYTAMTNALEENSWSVRLQWQAREVFLANGQTEAADEMVRKILERANGQRGAFRDAESMVVLGQAALLKGADPKLVLDTLFDPARKADPSSREACLASGQLALEKHDYALAAKRFEEALKQLPDDPDLRYGMAQAYASSDPALVEDAIEKALARNSNHVGILLLLADRTIDAEDYPETDRLLDRIQEVNPWSPEAWAFRAVVAHLRHQSDAEAAARENALKYWTNNPHVDQLIGLKLSQNYRFTEGAAHQRQALQFDPSYLPAKAQLAQDLLRLGEESEGWALADEVQKQDGYDVEMFNLTTLHDTMAKFTTITNTDFVVRMGAHEAAVYGDQALELLERARSNLCAKYGFQVQRPTYVEIFPDPKDFAVRTFGMPGNPGYLGVCFGTLVTANSSAAHPGHDVNWHSVLYHEFCHVVTLQITRNKMPRWLSEGISVYEEEQADPTWGQRMNPKYREMVLGGELTPISKLSGAFLAPRTPIHLQFAYYESSLVVEYLVQKYGLDSLKSILTDLGAGEEINKTIEKHTAALDDLEKEFAAYVTRRAENLAPGLDWEKPKLQDLTSTRRGSSVGMRAPIELGTNSSSGGILDNQPATAGSTAEALGDPNLWVDRHPTNYYALMERAGQLISQKQYETAKEPLKLLVERYSTQTGPECAYAMLCATYRALGETNAERELLDKYVRQDDEANEAFLRLAELDETTGDWPAVKLNAQRSLAVDPLVSAPYGFLARASSHLDDVNQAIKANRALLQLDPPNPAEVHFQLAQALSRSGDTGARRQVLQALEDAPRFRKALQLLLKLHDSPAVDTTNTVSGVKP